MITSRTVPPGRRTLKDTLLTVLPDYRSRQVPELSEEFELLAR